MSNGHYSTRDPWGSLACLMSTNEAPASAGHAREFQGRCPSPFPSLQQGWGAGKVGKAGWAMLLLLQDFVHLVPVQQGYSKGQHGCAGRPPVVRACMHSRTPRSRRVPLRVRHRQPSSRRPPTSKPRPPQNELRKGGFHCIVILGLKEALPACCRATGTRVWFARRAVMHRSTWLRLARRPL